MNGTEKMKIPKFLEGEPLQEGYFDGTNPYIDHPTCKIDFKALGDYIKNDR